MPSQGNGFYWVYIPEFNLAICAPPKCASRSLLYTLAKRYYPDVTYQSARPSEYKKKDRYYFYMHSLGVQPHWRRLAIIRHPVDRFISLWAHHCRDGTPGIPRHLRGKASMNDLLDYIQIHDNAHWKPQADIIEDRFKDTLYTTVEKASYTITLLTTGRLKLEHENKTKDKKGIIIPDDIMLRIQDYYSRDFDMFNRVTNG
jgi:hypothetical protein